MQIRRYSPFLVGCLTFVVAGCGLASHPTAVRKAPCEALTGYTAATGEARMPGPNGSMAGGVRPSDVPSGWTQVVPDGGILLMSAAYGGAWHLRGLTLSSPPSEAESRELMMGASVSGCLLAGNRLRVTRVQPIAASGVLWNQVQDAAAGVELVSPAPIQPGGPLLVLIQRNTEADALNLHGLGYPSPMHWYVLPMHSPGRQVRLPLIRAWHDTYRSGYLFSVPTGLAPGWYEVFLSSSPTSINAMPSADILFRVAPIR